jgi:S-adenosylmethionine:tRNA ribosyltransferase-isomerase
MKTDLFDYRLPEDRIAQSPVKPRDHSRLLVLERGNGAVEHRHFFEIGEFLKPGDLLVVNETKVFRARLYGTSDGHDVELLLLRPDGDAWLALGKPGKRLHAGAEILYSDGTSCKIAKKSEDGTLRIDFHHDATDVFEWADMYGDIPVPPYVTTAPERLDEYQTVYAKETGSVAAPTAGFHFTPELIEKLKSQGIRFASVILHVGAGTFRPMKTELVEEHEMHEEWLEVPDETRRAIQETKAAGRRVVAVGTTTVRALESNLDRGFTKLFITPGFAFDVVDALITNFHVPKSTLLVLVSAFAGEHHHDSDEGRRLILRAYEEAIKQGYRFYSFGDAMLMT